LFAGRAAARVLAWGAAEGLWRFSAWLAIHAIGSLSVGADADVVMLDPDLEQMVTPCMLCPNADYSVHAGWRVTPAGANHAAAR
jgi:hypothetical protein